MTHDPPDSCRVALARHQRVPDRQQDLADDYRRRVDQQVEREADRAFSGILDRHDAVVCPFSIERLKHRGDRWLRMELGAATETAVRRFMTVGVLGAEVGDPDALLERGTGRDYLGEDSLEMSRRERPLVVRNHPLEHLALARGLMNRSAAGLLQPADILRDARTFGEQIDQS
jgi:hypothetical protein